MWLLALVVRREFIGDLICLFHKRMFSGSSSEEGAIGNYRCLGVTITSQTDYFLLHHQPRFTKQKAAKECSAKSFERAHFYLTVSKVSFSNPLGAACVPRS